MGHVRVVAAAMACLFTLSTAPATADPDEVAQSERRLADAERDAQRAEARLGDLTREFELAVEAYNESSERLAAVQMQMAQLLGELQEVEQRLHDRQAVADRLARRLYRDGASFPLDAVMGADSAAEAQRGLFYLRSAARAQLTVVEALRGDRRVHAAKLGQLERIRAEATVAEQQLAAERRRVEETLAGQRDEVAELHATVTEVREAHAAALRQEQERLARERRERERREREARERAQREALERAAQEAAAAAARTAARTTTATTAPGPVTSNGPAGRTAVDAALSQLGKPYRWGAAGPDAYDCSGLTQWAWDKAGVSLPHSSRMQYSVTQRISRADLQLGDLIFFGSPIHHVAMYIGDGEVVEAPYGGSQVRVNARALSRGDITGYGRPRT